MSIMEYNLVRVIMFLIPIVSLVFILIDNIKIPSTAHLMDGIGKRNYKKEKKMRRELLLYKNKKKLKSYRVYDEVITVMNLKRKGMTVTSFKFILFAGSLFLSVTLSIIASISLVLLPLVWFLFYKVSFLMTRVLSSSLKERREMAIMDAVDLIVSDISSGVENSIRRYIPVFDRSIKREFEMFLMNRSKNMPFEDAMTELNYSLGATFDDFAEKALQFETAERQGMVELFSEIVELHAIKRELRGEVNVVFNKLRFEFMVALVMIIVLTVGMILVQPNLFKFYTKTLIGKLLLLADIGIVAFVLSSLIIIKSSDL